MLNWALNTFFSQENFQFFDNNKYHSDANMNTVIQ